MMLVPEHPLMSKQITVQSSNDRLYQLSKSGLVSMRFTA